MSFQHVYVPYGAYWSSPFCRWQGSLAGRHALTLAADTARAFLSARDLSPEVFDGVALGMTVPQRRSFYGAPWLAALLGAPSLTGPTVSQACATSARLLLSTALEVEAGLRRTVLGVACDRTSNGPHTYYPDPGGPGGMGEAESPVWDNFNLDPWGGTAMIQTAENVAKELSISRAEQDEVALLRHLQYGDAIRDDRAFQRRYMAEVPLLKGTRVIGVVREDEGIHPTTADGLARLKPVLPDGTTTSGAQTHPADGNAGMVVCSRDQARLLSRRPEISIRLLGFGDARVKKACMPAAVVPAAQAALEHAGVKIGDCSAVKTHNPFALNDIVLARGLGLAQDGINRFGSPLVYGHPQGPTGLRAVIELIEELVDAGGGIGLFTGCAAGDTAMALVLRVG